MNNKMKCRCITMLISLPVAIFLLYQPIQIFLSQLRKQPTHHSTIMVTKDSLTPVATKHGKDIKINDIFNYKSEIPVRSGNLIEERNRLRLFLSTQGAICQNIQRIGGAKPEPWQAPRPLGPDGAWDVCFDSDVGLQPSSCIVYSFGIGRDFSFDDGMASHGCQVFSFDPTVGQPDHDHSKMVKFFNTGLSDTDQNINGTVAVDASKFSWKTRTLASIIQELKHDKGFVDLVKMDIEGDEWTCLRSMLADGSLRHYVRQLDVELHLVARQPDAMRDYYSIVKWLHRQEFKVFSLHQNPYCSVCLEMSFINTRLRGLSVL